MIPPHPFIQRLVQVDAAVLAEPTDDKWAHESEASVVIVSGNTSTEAYNAKHSTTYSFGRNRIASMGRYRRQVDASRENARTWGASLRYERALDERIAVFIGRSAESDIYAGTVQRDSTDIGAKYFFVKSEDEAFFVEMGYRPSFENRVAPASDGTTLYGRIYTEWARVWSANIAHRIWVEYLPNLEKNDDFLFNAEPSIDSKLTEIFALRLSYLFKYRGKPPLGLRYRDTVYSTSLVVKF